jgi:hypothetical protein
MAMPIPSDIDAAMREKITPGELKLLMMFT